MQRSRRKDRKKNSNSVNFGTSPGTMVFIGEQKLEKAQVDVIEYNAEEVKETLDLGPEKFGELAASSKIKWININGIHDIDLIATIGKAFELHPLTLEDIVNTSQRLKIEEYANYLFIVLKMIKYSELSEKIEIEHISLILGKNYVISFQEYKGDVFNPVRDRIRQAKGRIRSMNSDYLAYALMDAVVDNYFLGVEHIGDCIEDLDDKVMTDPRPDSIKDIHTLKREILNLRKAVWPLREVISSIEKSDSSVLHKEVRVFWRDLYDHTIQIIDMVETFRDILGGVHDIYLSSVSNRMNDIMKFLTIISTIFIPMTFIAGVYGMNFEFIPELKWPYGYFFAWGFMLLAGLGQTAYFKRKKWI